MKMRDGVRHIAIAVIALAATHAIEDALGTPRLVVQTVCWTAVAVASLVLVVPPGRGAFATIGWLLFALGGAGTLLPGLRAWAPFLAWASLSFLLRASAFHRGNRRILMTACLSLALGAHLAPLGPLRPCATAPLSTAITVAAVGLILHHAFVGPFLAIMATHVRLRADSAVALRVVGQMEHADPRHYTTQPHLLRLLEIVCRSPELSNRELAERLSLSTRSVETYMNRLLKVTGVDNRRQLVAVFEYWFLARGGGVG